MKNKLSASFLVAAASLALATLAITGEAQAQTVYWSVGVSSPGLQLGLFNAPPPRVYLQPEAVYVQPAPVYVRPTPVYVPSAPVYVQPAPVYVAAPAYIRADWRYPGQHRGWRQWQQRHGEERHEHEHEDYRR